MINNQKTKENMKGFIVAGILLFLVAGVILASFVLVTLTTSELTTIGKALKSYHMNKGRYPEVEELDNFRQSYLAGKNPFWSWNRKDHILYADPEFPEQEYVLDWKGIYSITKEIPPYLRLTTYVLFGVKSARFIQLNPKDGIVIHAVLP